MTDYKADLADKKEYDPGRVPSIVEEQSSHFVELVKATLLDHFRTTGKVGALTAPFDTELFGHWWFEGCLWISTILRKIAADEEIGLRTGSRFLEDFGEKQLVTLPEGSWGEGGFHYIWLNDQNDWTWKKIYAAEERFLSLIRQHSKKEEKTGLLTRLLKQAARELLLLESSDWQFLISTWSAKDYAEERVSLHFENFQRLNSILEGLEARKGISKENLNFLQDLEQTDGIFQDIDLSFWLKP